jgi:hypothetical protein
MYYNVRETLTTKDIERAAWQRNSNESIFRAFVSRLQRTQKKNRAEAQHTHPHQITCLCLCIFHVYNGSVLSRQSQCSARTYVCTKCCYGRRIVFVRLHAAMR